MPRFVEDVSNTFSDKLGDDTVRGSPRNFLAHQSDRCRDSLLD